MDQRANSQNGPAKFPSTHDQNHPKLPISTIIPSTASKYYLHQNLPSIRPPQGSSLSPVLFNIYINDIPSTNNTALAIYADDTAIISESYQARKAKIYAQRHLNQLQDYFEKWKLQANPQKTQNIIFTWRNKRYQNKTLKFYNTDIQDEETSVKYLGIHLDKRLTFRKHIEETSRKAYAASKFIRPYLHITNPLSKGLKKQLYIAYVRSILTYACPTWSSAATNHRNKLQVIENRCLRAISGKTITEIKNTDLYEEHKITPILTHIRKQTRKFYTQKVKQLEYTQNIGAINKTNAPFIIKHKLINEDMFRET